MKGNKNKNKNTTQYLLNNEWRNEMDETVAVEYAQLFGLTSTGKVKTWQVAVIDLKDGTAAIDQTYGELDGKLQTNRKIIREGKNLGKANATTPIEQANSEAESKFTKKYEQEGYAVDKDNLRIPKLPMLAQVFEKAKHRIVYPAILQAKLNGVRCFAERVSDTEILYTSRKGKAYTTLEHLTPTLLGIMEVGEIFDGEIYNHDMTFQEITSAVKKQREGSLRLEFWVYDLADAEKDYIDRFDRLDSTVGKMPKDSQVKILNVYNIKDEEDIQSFHSVLVQDGFEGVIIRNLKGGYSFKHRSANLQKYKEFIDAEFLIVGGYTGKGTSFEGAVTFECQATNGETFGCVPKGPFEYKRELWANLAKIVEAKTLLTVRYQELSDSGIPIFPIGISLRSGEFGYE